jgi:hypothetical protein
MTSQIDVKVPVYGNPKTEDERRNWQTAASEITALQDLVTDLQARVTALEAQIAAKESA